MGHGDYGGLTPEAIDQVWERLRAGQAARPTARDPGHNSARKPQI